MIENLTTEQRDAMLRFLLHRMGHEARLALMANLPLAYATLYPTASAATIEHVTEEILTMAEVRRTTPTYAGADGARYTIPQD